MFNWVWFVVLNFVDLIVLLIEYVIKWFDMKNKMIYFLFIEYVFGDYYFLLINYCMLDDRRSDFYG